MCQRSEALRDLVFVLLGVEADLVRRDGLAAALRALQQHPERPIVDVLREHGVVRPDAAADLEARVGAFLAHDEVAATPNAELPTVAADGEPRPTDTLPTEPDVEATQPADGETLPMSSLPHLDEPAGPGPRPSANGAARFEVIVEHAKGGIGVVFLARDSELNREVALKQMQPRHADNPSSRSRFLLEAEVTGGLEHPGIVPVYAFGADAQGRPYYAMRFIRGDSLKEAIEHFHKDETLRSDPGRRSLEQRKLLRRFLDVCNTIEFAHGRGVLHRDIKPANIIVGKHGETLVVDWGIAKVGGRPDPLHDSPESVLFAKAHTGATETLPGSAMGTPAYMSPEQAAGALDRLSPASDVYSLGATLYCLLTGQPPFEDTVLARVLARVKVGDFVPPRKLDRSIPAPLEAICLKAMAREPADRYATARSLAEDVERWMADEPVTALRDPLLERTRRWMRQRRTTVASVAAAVLVAMVGLVVVLGVQQRANRDLRLANEREHDRFKLALDAIGFFHKGITGDFMLQQEEFKDQRTRLLSSARDFYRRLERLLVDETDLPSRKALGQSYYDVGELTSRISEKDEALRSHHRALEIRKALADGPEGTDIELNDLAASYSAIATIDREQGNTSDAADRLNRALAIRKGLAERHPDSSDYRRDLAWCHHQMGYLHEKLIQNELALKSYEAALAIRLALVKQWPDNPRHRYDLAASYNTIGRLLPRLGRSQEVMAYLERALEIRERLVDQYPNESDYLHSLAVSYHTIANRLALSGQSERAIDAFGKALALREALVKSYPAVSVLQVELAAVASDMAGNLYVAGNPDALKMFERSRDIERQLLLANPNVTRVKTNLAISLISIGIINEEQGHPEQALASFEEARGYCQSLVDTHPDQPDLRRRLAEVYAHLGRLFAGWGRVNEALWALDRQVADLEALSANSPSDATFRRALATARADRADVLASQGHLPEALRDFDQAIVAQTSIAGADPTDINAKQTLVSTQERRALALARNGHARAALGPLQEAARTRDQLLRDRPDDPLFLQAAAGGQAALGEALNQADRASEAVDLLRNVKVATAHQVDLNPRNHRLALNLARVAKLLGDSFAATGQPAQAAGAYRQSLRTLTVLDPLNAGDMELLASLHASLAQLAGVPGSEVDVADGPAERVLALASLRAAVKAGFRDQFVVLNRTEYMPLMHRPDFQAIIADLAFPLDPFLPPRARADASP